MTKKIISILLSVFVIAGAVTSTFSVEAAAKNRVKTSISKIESKSKGFKVTWSKKSKIKGYQIQYSTSSKFKGAATKTVSKATTKTATISKLKGCNVKYYVRVRTYKTSKSNKIYSPWSKAKQVTTLAHNFSGNSCAYCGAKNNTQKTYTLTEQQLKEIVDKAVADALAKQTEFIPGEELTCPLGKSFNFLISNRDTLFATITNFTVKTKKIADPNNPADYFNGNYWRYIYEVELTGKVDPSYNIARLDIITALGDGSVHSSFDVPVNADGSFSLNAILGSQKIEKSIILSRIYDPSWC